MKFKVYYLLLFFAVFFTTETFAQVDRSIGTGQYRRPKAKNTGPYDYVAETAKYYQKELTLDDFQVAAIKEILTSEKESIGNMREQQDITKEERRDKASEINERIDKKIMPMLSPDQLKKYQALIDKRKG